MFSFRTVRNGLLALCLATFGVPVLTVHADTSSTGATLYPSTPIFSGDFSSSTMSPFVPNNGLSPGGNWQISGGSLVATDYGDSGSLPNQIAGVPKMPENVMLTTSFTINKVDPNQYFRIGLFGRGSAPGTGTSQWDFLLNKQTLEFINQNVNYPASIPFQVASGQSYQMMMVIDGNWVGGKVWPTGSPEPSQWTLAAVFKSTGNFTTVGVAAANADVSFHNFAVYNAPPILTVTPTQPGAVFFGQTPATYEASVQSNATDESGTYYVNYQVAGINGSTVAQGQVPVDVPGNGTANVQVALPVHQYGYYKTSFSLTNQPAAPNASGTSPIGQVVGLTTGSMALIPQANNLGVTAPSSRFGINGPGNENGVITPAMQAQWTNVYSLLKEQGIQWARTEFRWNFVEPSPGVYTWNQDDGLVEAAHQTKMNLLGLLDYWGNYANPFGAKPQVSFTTALQDYDQYVQAVVKRYMPGGTLAQQMGWKNYGITAWEVWNEPSTRNFWLSQNPAQYAELVKSASAAIKAVDPSATILAYGWQRSVLLSGAGTQSFTGISIHDYPGPVAPPESLFFGGVQNWKQFLAQSGMPNAPLWMTESGWTTQSVTPQQQAQYLAQAEIQSLAAGLDKFFMFSWFYPGTDPGGGYGELTGSPSDLMPKPSYAALAGVASELHGFTSVGASNPMNMGTAIQAYAFQNGSKSLVAIWANGEEGTLSLHPPGDLKAFDWVGNSIGVTNGSLSVPLTGSPVYIQSNMSVANLENVIQHGTVTGIAPVAVSISNLSGMPTTLPDIHLTVTNQINTAQSGTVTLNLPAGWKASAATSSSVTGATYNPSVTGATYTPSINFSNLAPGESISPVFHLAQFEANASNQYTIAVSATAQSNTSSPHHGRGNSSGSTGTSTVTSTLPISAYESVYGTPNLTGTFKDWGNAVPVYLDLPSQNVGIPNWSPSVESATGYTMWDSKYFYFAAKVNDTLFNEPYTGFNTWQGDSIQAFFDPQNLKTTSFNANGGDVNFGLASTPAGPQVYEFQGPHPGLRSDVKLRVVPGPSGGDMWYEAAIPLSDLQGLTPASGHAFGFNFLVNDNNGNGRLGWIWLAPGIGNGWNPSDFPTFTLVKGAGLAAVRLNSSTPTATATFSPNSQGATLVVDNQGLPKITIALSNGTSLTLVADNSAKASVTPTGSNPVVSVLPNGTTSINLSNYTTPGSSMSLSAFATPASGQSAIIAVDGGMQ